MNLRPASANDIKPTASSINKRVRGNIANLLSKDPVGKTSTPAERIADVRKYLSGNRNVKAITVKGDKLTVHTTAELSASYTFVIE
jgi:hypothetical protein